MFIPVEGNKASSESCGINSGAVASYLLSASISLRISSLLSSKNLGHVITLIYWLRLVKLKNNWALLFYTHMFPDIYKKLLERKILEQRFGIYSEGQIFSNLISIPVEGINANSKLIHVCWFHEALVPVFTSLEPALGLMQISE